MGIGNFGGAHVSDYDNWGELGSVTSIPTGIVSASTAITVSYSATAPEFTITPTGPTFTYYLKGVKYVVTGPLSYTFGVGGNPALTEGTWYFYLTSTKTIGATKVTGAAVIESLILSYALCGLGYWDSTEGTWMVRGWEGHGPGMDPTTHAYLHDAFGARWEAGLALSDFTIAGAAPTGDTESQFSYTAGGIHDEDINFSILASVAPASLPVWYRDGAANWRFQAASTLPVIYDGSTRLQYNSVAGGVWGQTTIGQGNYVLCHVFATTDLFYPIICIQGQAEYTLTASAYAGALTELKDLFLTGLPTPEMVPLGTVMYQTNSTWAAATKHCKVVYVNTDNDVYIDWREQDRLGGGGSGGGGTSDHSALSNLDYASAGHTGFVPSTRTVSTTAPLAGGGDLSADRTLSISVATALADGYLDKDDFATFAAKQDALTTGNLTATSPILLDQTRQVIGGAAVISLNAAYTPRERLTANRTYYVRTDGNDANTGLVDSAAGAFLTVQHAIDVISGTLDLGVYTTTIQVGSGTYAAIVLKPLLGGNCILLGNTTTPSNVALSSAGTTITAQGLYGSSWTITGFRVSSSGGNAILVENSLIRFGVMDYATAAVAHIYCGGNGTVWLDSNYTISGSVGYHLWATEGGIIRAANTLTVTISIGVAFSGAFVFVLVCALVRFRAATFSGSATGVRYLVTTNGVIDTNGGGANYFPGDSAGSSATGGQYL